eukprot:3569526-Amphidinium_carterae.1
MASRINQTKGVQREWPSFRGARQLLNQRSLAVALEKQLSFNGGSNDECLRAEFSSLCNVQCTAARKMFQCSGGSGRDCQWNLGHTHTHICTHTCTCSALKKTLLLLGEAPFIAGDESSFLSAQTPDTKRDYQTHPCKKKSDWDG